MQIIFIAISFQRKEDRFYPHVIHMCVLASCLQDIPKQYSEFYLWVTGLTVPSIFSCLLPGSRDKSQPLTLDI